MSRPIWVRPNYRLSPILDLTRRVAVVYIQWLDDRHGTRLEVPGQVLLTPLREERMAKIKVNVYEASLPELPTDHDVVKRTVTVMEGGAEKFTVDKTPGDPPFEIKVTQGATFSIRLTDSDGRNSKVSNGPEMVAEDEFEPAEPGQVALRSIREEWVDDATGQTVPAPTV